MSLKTWSWPFLVYNGKPEPSCPLYRRTRQQNMMPDLCACTAPILVTAHPWRIAEVVNRKQTENIPVCIHCRSWHKHSVCVQASRITNCTDRGFKGLKMRKNKRTEQWCSKWVPPSLQRSALSVMSEVEQKLWLTSNNRKMLIPSHSVFDIINK